MLTGQWWGSGAVFGIARLGANQAYWSATARVPSSDGGSPEDEKANLLHRFAAWRPPITELIDASVAEAITRTPLLSRPALAHRSAGRVALLGDAAALTSPSLAQGACQAIEDAGTLVESLLSGTDETSALERYSDRRRRHLHMVARRGQQLSRLAHLQNPAAVALRNAVLPAVTVDGFGWLAPIVGPETPTFRS